MSDGSGRDANSSGWTVTYINQTMPGRYVLILLIQMLLAMFSGCADLEPSSYQEVERFLAAGPITPELDGELMVASCWKQQYYRLVCGDIIELEMPAIMKVSASELPEWSGKRDPYSCRVDDKGRINLPVIGQVTAAGLTLSELENKLSQIYYPRYVVTYPSIVASVREYCTARVSVVGAVKESGIYELRSNEMSLVNLLMKAGGIAEDGAAVIRIAHAEGGDYSKPIILPVKGYNVPFEDAVLRNGDTVIVEPLLAQTFTVVGLVKRPGAFPFSPGIRYNLMQALAYAGGLDEVAAPKYVRIYRQASDGEIVSALFPLHGREAESSLAVNLKPGDVIAVEPTQRTRTRKLLAEIVQFNLGMQTMYRLDNKDSD